MLLAGISVVTIIDMLVAMYFRSLAERVESGETVSSSIDPEKARKSATAMLIFAPLMWLVVALMSFGAIPSGIDPIQS